MREERPIIAIIEEKQKAFRLMEQILEALKKNNELLHRIALRLENQ